MEEVFGLKESATAALEVARAVKQNELASNGDEKAYEVENVGKR